MINALKSLLNWARQSRGVFFFLGATIGVTGSWIVHKSDLVAVDSTITVGNVLQSLATILTGLIVAAYLQPQTQADRKEKEIFLKHFDLLLDDLEAFEEANEEGVLTKVVAALKQLTMKFRTVRDLATHLSYDVEILAKLGFDGLIKDLRSLATETPIRELEEYAKSKTCKSSQVRDWFIQLAEEKKLALTSKIQELKLAILKAQTQVNKT